MVKKTYSMNEIVQILYDNGFVGAGWKGSHFRMKRGNMTVHIDRNSVHWTVYIKQLFKRIGLDPSDYDLREIRKPSKDYVGVKNFDK